MTSYLDASAVLRILFDEPGPSISLGSSTTAASSRLVEVEAFRAVDRARLRGFLSDAETARKSKELHSLLAKLHLVPVSDAIVRLARSTFPVNVRALDALHVATAQLLVEQVGALEFWTHDARQSDAALSRGLDVRGTA